MDPIQKPRVRRAFVGYLDSYRGAVIACALQQHGFEVCGCVNDPKNAHSAQPLWNGSGEARHENQTRSQSEVGTFSEEAERWAVDQVNPSALAPVTRGVILAGLAAASTALSNTNGRTVVWRGDTMGMRTLLSTSHDVVMELTAESSEDVLNVSSFLAGNHSDIVSQQRLIVLSTFLTWHATPPLAMDQYEGKRRAEGTVSSGAPKGAAEKLMPPRPATLSSQGLPLFTVEAEVVAEAEAAMAGTALGDGNRDDEDAENLQSRREIFSEDQFNRRIAHAKYAACREVERRIVAFNNSASNLGGGTGSGVSEATGAKLSTSVVFAGLCYGWGEAFLGPLLRQAWCLFPDGLPVYGSGEQVIPMIHVSDLGRFIAQLLLRTLPEKPDAAPAAGAGGSGAAVKDDHEGEEPLPRLPLHPYYFAADNGSATWMKIIKAIHRALGNFSCFHVPPPQFPLHANVEQFTVDLRVDNRRMCEVMGMGGGGDDEVGDHVDGESDVEGPEDGAPGGSHEWREKAFAAGETAKVLKMSANSHCGQLSISSSITDDHDIAHQVVQSTLGRRAYGGPPTRWIAQRGFVKNIERVVHEFVVSRHITPLRIVLMGPPMAGKSRLAAELGKRYSLPHFSISDIIEAYKAHVLELEATVEAIRAALISRKQQEKYLAQQRAAGRPPVDSSIPGGHSRELEVDGSPSARRDPSGKALADTGNGFVAVLDIAGHADTQVECDDDSDDDSNESNDDGDKGASDADAGCGDGDREREGTSQWVSGAGGGAAWETSSRAVAASGAGVRAVKQLRLTKEELQELEDMVSEELAEMDEVKRLLRDIETMKRVLQLKVGATVASPGIPEPPHPKGKISGGAVPHRVSAPAVSAAGGAGGASAKRGVAGSTLNMSYTSKKDVTASDSTSADALRSAPYQDKALAIMVRWKLSSKQCRSHGYILDGFPKTPAQAHYLFEKPGPTLGVLDPLISTLDDGNDEDGDAKAPVAAAGRGGVASEVPQLFAPPPGSGAGASPASLFFCDEALLPDLLVTLSAPDAFLYQRLLHASGEHRHNTPDDFLRRLHAYKQSFEFMPFNLLRYMESACTRPRQPVTAGYRRARMVSVDATIDPVAPPPPPDSPYELTPLSRVAQRLCDEAIGVPHKIGMSIQDVLREVMRQRQLAAEKAAKADELAEARRQREAEVAAEERSRRLCHEEAVERMKAQERSALEQRKEPLRKYMMDNVVPLLTKGLLAVSAARPDDPVDYLATWLLRHNPHDRLFHDL